MTRHQETKSRGTKVHAALNLNGNYRTLCGNPGDSIAAGHTAASRVFGGQINCSDCIALIRAAKRYRDSDFAEALRHQTHAQRWSDPEFRKHQAQRQDATREKATAAFQARMADPMFRARNGYLQEQEIEQIKARLIAGDKHVDIAVDWLVERSTISRIAGLLGLTRRKRKS